MKALLINPWVYDFACYDLFNKPLALLEIASLLKDNGFRVELIDAMDRFHPALTEFLKGKDAAKYQKSPCGNYYSEEVEKPAVYKDIPRKYKRHGMPEALFRELLKDSASPEIILVTSGMTYWYRGAFEAIRILKETFPGTPVFLGGIYASLSHEHAVKYSGADKVFKGINLFDRVRQKRYPPAYELYPRLEYITLRTSNGCPNRCSYCAWHLLDPEFRQDEPHDVVEQITSFYKELGVKRFAFYDEALLYKAEDHIIPILEGILDSRIKAEFYTPNGLHARFVTRELAGLFRKCNFIEPRLGFESSNILRQMTTGGKVDNESLEEAVFALESAGYASHEIGVNILIGLPGQRPDEIESSIRFAHSSRVRVHLEEYSPVPGTLDYKRCGFAEDADPLLHNNSVFPLHNKDTARRFQELKELNQKLNKEIKRSIMVQV